MAMNKKNGSVGGITFLFLFSFYFLLLFLFCFVFSSNFLKKKLSGRYMFFIQKIINSN